MKVFVLAGQSNMLGGAPIEDLPLEFINPRPDVLYQFRLDGEFDHDTIGWEQLRPLEPGYPGTTYASELSFGAAMADRLGESIAIVKVAASGTSLNNHWNPFNPTGIYTWFTDKVDASLAQLTALGHEPSIAGFVWVQGEGDANLLITARAYEHHLNTFIQQVRTDLETPDMPFLFNELHADAQRLFGDELRQSQRNVALAASNAYLVNADDLQLLSDNLHFTGAMQVELGRRFADVLIPSADFNTDGLVNGADLGILKASVGTDRLGDANADGVADGTDFLIWQRQTTGGEMGGTQPVPEPTTFAAAAIFGIAAAISSWRQSRLRRRYASTRQAPA